MPAGARTHRPMNTPKPMSFTITTDRATTPRAHTLLDIFRHKRNRPNRLPRSPSCASASRNRPVGGGLPMVEQSGHHVDVTAPGVKHRRAARSWRLPLWTSTSSAGVVARKACRRTIAFRAKQSSDPAYADECVRGIAITPPRPGRTPLAVDSDRRAAPAGALPSGRTRKRAAAGRRRDPDDGFPGKRSRRSKLAGAGAHDRLHGI